MQTQVLIIGGGATGTGLARDLALRGIHCILAERRDLDAGASGANHGLLHSGGRYVYSDPDSAAQCRSENALLKKLAPQCIKDTGGLFIAVEGDGEEYPALFPHLCAKSGISAQPLSRRKAMEMEPLLTGRLTAVYEVDDATIDPFRLSLENMNHASALGAVFLRHCEITGFESNGGTVRRVQLVDALSRKKLTVEAEQVVNAAGAWAGKVAELAGISIPLVVSAGTLLVAGSRLSSRVLNRLRFPSDGDIVVPGGTVSILGTTSIRVENPDEVRPTAREVETIVRECKALLPSVEVSRFIRAFSGARPLIATVMHGDDRFAGRGFSLIDHLSDGLDNFVTIAGGKLTTFRLMAEKTADLVSLRLGNTRPCMTAMEPLPVSRVCSWTEPGCSPRLWLKKENPGSVILCECEMVSSTVVECIAGYLREGGDKPDLKSIALRSRVGKGPCQGTFCGVQVTAYLYEERLVDSTEGLQYLIEFLVERWKGTRSVLWDTTIAQAELQEAVYCGLLCLEILETEKAEPFPES